MSTYKELQAQVTLYRERVDRRLEKALRDNGKQMSAEMRSRVPVDTGNLKRSIRYSVVRTADGLQLRFHANATSEDEVKYAEFIEYGTGIYEQYGRGRKTDLPWIVTAKVHGEMRTWTTYGMKAHPFVRPVFAKFRARFNRMGRYIMEVS